MVRVLQQTTAGSQAIIDAAVKATKGAKAAAAEPSAPQSSTAGGEAADAEPSQAKVCRFFLQGRCRNGAKCKDLHSSVRKRRRETEPRDSLSL